MAGCIGRDAQFVAWLMVGPGVVVFAFQEKAQVTIKQSMYQIPSQFISNPSRTFTFCWPESKYGSVSGPQWKWKSGASRFPHVAKALV